MVLKKIDIRIRTLIENCIEERKRSLFVIVGEKSRDQVVILHHMLSKAQVKARPSVLWCYKKELGFSQQKMKRFKKLKKQKYSGTLNTSSSASPFDLFVMATSIRYVIYAETHKILGNTYGMVVLQDFEGLTPNTIARTVETVEGGGCICFLLNSVSSLKQLFTLCMDVHSRYRTDANQIVEPRFNERFILSLSDCSSCMIIDDQLEIIPLCHSTLNIQPIPKKNWEEVGLNFDKPLKDFKDMMKDKQPIGSLVECCKTLDQAHCLVNLIGLVSEKNAKDVASVTAARGRGKSACLGLAIASAISFGFSNIFVTSPSPENLKTLFEFVLKGFDALFYKEHLDFEVIQSTNPDFQKAVVRITVFRKHRQVIHYIQPQDWQKSGCAELMVIDEAAAIPLPLVKSLMGPYLVFLASTINGYEGTGRSLSLKLLTQLRSQTNTSSVPLQSIDAAGESGLTQNVSNNEDLRMNKKLHEFTLNQAIRYADGDYVESWLNKLLCLDQTPEKVRHMECVSSSECSLYYVHRDTLFSYHKPAEKVLHNLVSIYVSSHYKNTPNDLQLLADAPAHHIFCLLSPDSLKESKRLPTILCVIQLCFEGQIRQETTEQHFARGRRASGDLIPWTLSQQFSDADFASLSGARIVRIAVHPDFVGMGYGSRAMELLLKYFQSEIPCVNEFKFSNDIDSTENAIKVKTETLKPKSRLPPLFLKLTERRAEKLDYIGVSYGVTPELFKFWTKMKFTPLYVRQTPSELTGEHTCIMIRRLDSTNDHSIHDQDGTDQEQQSSYSSDWLSEYYYDFQKRFFHLLGYQFRTLPCSMALSFFTSKLNFVSSSGSERYGFKVKSTINHHFTPHDLKRLQLYSDNMVDHHLITDLLPTISYLYFMKMINVTLTPLQAAILLAIGSQHKTIDDVSIELKLVSSQTLGLFNKIIRKITRSMDIEHEMVLIDDDRTSVQKISDDQTECMNEPISDQFSLKNEEISQPAMRKRKRSAKDSPDLAGSKKNKTMKKH